MIPGEIITPDQDIEMNVGRQTLKMTVANAGDRPIQIGSHFHFYEANDALQFNRELTKGYRLNIAAGTAVRFEPGQSRNIELVALVGKKEVYGFAGRVMGKLD
jgi:urease subunit beta